MLISKGIRLATPALAEHLPKLEFIVQSYFISQHSCPYCDSSTSILIKNKKGRVTIQRCTSCRIAYTSPLYRSMFSSDFYDKFYQCNDFATTLPGDGELKRILDKGFSGTDRHQADRIEKITKVLEKFELPKSVLEIGSSWGYFLWQAIQNGLDAVGVEIGKTRREFGKIKLSVPIYDDIGSVPPLEFGAVYTSHTLEHFTDLKGIFDRISSRLVDRGILIIETPHFSPEHQGDAAYKMMGAVHPLGFDKKWYITQLMEHHFRLLGMYPSWEEFPDFTDEFSSESGNIIVMAQLHKT